MVKGAFCTGNGSLNRRMGSMVADQKDTVDFNIG